MLLSVTAGLLLAPVTWLIGTLAGVASAALLDEMRTARQVSHMRQALRHL